MFRRRYGQNTGSDAMVVAMLTSRIESTIGVDAYQLGSKVGHVVALCSTRETRRTMEQMTHLFGGGGGFHGCQMDSQGR